MLAIDNSKRYDYLPDMCTTIYSRTITYTSENLKYSPEDNFSPFFFVYFSHNFIKLVLLSFHFWIFESNVSGVTSLTFGITFRYESIKS